MRQRVESLDGTLDFQSTNGRGTVISIRIPLKSFRAVST
jgi:signal transduction histidine kinase